MAPWIIAGDSARPVFIRLAAVVTLVSCDDVHIASVVFSWKVRHELYDETARSGDSKIDIIDTADTVIKNFR